jgi:hypothetical protein
MTRKKGGNIFTNIITAIRGQRNAYSPKLRKFLHEYGHMKILEMSVARVPVTRTIQVIANALSEGKYAENLASLHYDDIYHLYLLCKLENGVTIAIEKNHQIEISGHKERKGEKTMPVDMHGTTPSINELLNKGYAVVGNNRWFHYDPVKFNCQYFLKWIIEGNGLLTPSLEKFIMQDAEKILANTGLEGYARSLTDIRGRLSILFEGAGAPNRIIAKKTKNMKSLQEENLKYFVKELQKIINKHTIAFLKKQK